MPGKRNFANISMISYGDEGFKFFLEIRGGDYECSLAVMMLDSDNVKLLVNDLCKLSIILDNQKGVKNAG
jgi:hypothetical protein